MKLTIAKNPFEHNWQDYPEFEDGCVSLFFQGCTLKCKNCHNQALWDKSLGEEVLVDDLVLMTLRELERNMTNNLVLVGGEPLQQDFEALSNFVFKLKLKGVKIALYTGYKYEEKWEQLQELPCDFVLCGRYDESKRQVAFKSERLKEFHMGSTNQEVYHHGKLISVDGVAYL